MQLLDVRGCQECIGDRCGGVLRRGRLRKRMDGRRVGGDHGKTLLL